MIERSQPRWSAYVLLLSAWMLVCSTEPAHAQPRTSHRYALNWVRAPGAEACISSGQLARRIEELIGPVFSAPDAADRALEGFVQPRASETGFAVHVRIAAREGGSLGERAFESDATDCGALSDSIVLVTVLMVDPQASERGLPPELLGMLQDGARPEAELLAELEKESREAHAYAQRDVDIGQHVKAKVDEKPSEVKEKAAAESREQDEDEDKDDGAFALDIAVTGALAYDVLPSFTPGLGGSARLRTPAIAIRLSVDTWLPSEKTLADDMGKEAITTFGATTAALSACLPFLTADDVELDACAGVSLVARWFDSGLAIGSHERRHAQLGPTAAVDARYLLATNWFLLGSLGVLTMLPGTSFYYTGAGGRELMYEPALFGFRLDAGVGARL